VNLSLSWEKFLLGNLGIKKKQVAPTKGDDLLLTNYNPMNIYLSRRKANSFSSISFPLLFYIFCLGIKFEKKQVVENFHDCYQQIIIPWTYSNFVCQSFLAISLLLLFLSNHNAKMKAFCAENKDKNNSLWYLYFFKLFLKTTVCGCFTVIGTLLIEKMF